ncbi:MAG: hypothetical protein ISS15_13355 [Alphaproteobacteria bacterium]|nr:hypothetical protein [Alphaproteobacteria bacterium]MBL7098640.1 hypothetical protein [Alphaproteobacteria bacterium]
MPSLLLPRQIDNTFRGWRLGLWLFVPVLIVRLGIGFQSAFNARETAMNADGIPLNLYGEAGANEAVALFALLGFAGLLIALLGVLVLVRYRSMIPLMYLLFLLHQLGNKVLNALHPTLSGGAKTVAGGVPVASIVVYGLLGLAVLGFVLSLIPRGERT